MFTLKRIDCLAQNGEINVGFAGTDFFIYEKTSSICYAHKHTHTSTRGVMRENLTKQKKRERER